MALEPPEIAALAEQVVRQRGRRARARCAFHAGVRKAVDLESIGARAPRLRGPETLAALLEGFPAAPPDDRRRLGRLALALLEEAVDQELAPREQETLAGLGAAQLSVEYELIALPDGMRERRTSLDRKRRAALFREESHALEPVFRLAAERVERTLALRSHAGLGDEAAACGLFGADLEALTSASEQLLRQTRDAAQELTAYRFRRARIDPGGGGTEHDLEAALELLDLREQLNPSAAVQLSEQLPRDLGLDPFAGGRVTLDAEPRGGRFPGLRVGLFGPDELAVVSAPQGSPVDVERLVVGRGQALHRAAIDGHLQLPDRALLDPTLPRATGLLFARVLAEPAWLRRVLRLPSRPAQELAQAFGLRALLQLRADAARLLVARELERAGPSPRLRELYRERLGQALGVEVPGHGAFDTSLEQAAAALSARALAAALDAALRESFNEDWWRNPHATELLQAFWANGGAVELEPLLGRVPPLSVLAPDAIARAAR